MTNLPTSNETESTSNLQKHRQISVDVTTDVTDAVEKTADSVVGITNIQSVTDFWNHTETTQEAGTGSGVIYKKEDGKALCYYELSCY